MKNLMIYLEQDPFTREYSLASRNSKYKMDLEDYFFELPKTTRFRKDPVEKRTLKSKLRVKNPF